jgi:hypothetical protein
MAGMRARVGWTGSVFAIVAAVAALVLAAGVPQRTQPLPDRLDDEQFWRISQESSEPDGTFHSENLVSNEIRFQTIIPDLTRTVSAGRAYIGVGSEQNFTYIAAVRPAVAFIVDLRRGNLDLHLIYKTFFELSADRAEFVSRLFSRPRPAMLTATSSVDEIFAAYAGVAPSEELYAANLRTIEAHLTKTHGFTLLDGDRDGIRFVYRSWFEAGPDIHYQLTGRGGRGGGFPTYADLMTTTDGEGRHRSYLASDEAFRFIKDLQTRNLVIPVVGNFGGPKALRAVAAWLREHQTTVGAFYTSNVEQYLRRDGLWDTFCESAATFPIDATSTFIRSERGGFAGAPNRGIGGFWLGLEPVADTTARCGTR